MGWVGAGGEATERHPVGHAGPITKTLSARQWAYQPPFHTSLINWEDWEEDEGMGKGASLYQPSKCQRMGRAPHHHHHRHPFYWLHGSGVKTGPKSFPCVQTLSALGGVSAIMDRPHLSNICHK